MKNESAKTAPIPVLKNGYFSGEAYAFICEDKEWKNSPEWAKKARAQVLKQFNYLANGSELYKRGYEQGLTDMMALVWLQRLCGEAFAATFQRRNKRKYETNQFTGHELWKNTDSERSAFYAGKADARESFRDGGLTPRQKCMFFMALNHKVFEGATQKRVHKTFVALKFIRESTDESQTRQWLGDIGFRSGKRGRPANPKT